MKYTTLLIVTTIVGWVGLLIAILVIIGPHKTKPTKKKIFTTGTTVGQVEGWSYVDENHKCVMAINIMYREGTKKPYGSMVSLDCH